MKAYLIPGTALVVCVVLGMCLRAALNSGPRQMASAKPVGTNSARASSLKKDALKQLEDDLFKPMKSFSPENSLEGVVAPQLQPAAPTPAQAKRARSAHDREKDWAFLSPEELIPGATTEDILKLKEYEAAEKDPSKSTSGNDKFLSHSDTLHMDFLERSRKKADSLAPEWDSRAGQKALAQQDSDGKLPSGLLEREQALKRLFNSSEAPPDVTSGSEGNSLNNVFGLGHEAPRPELPDAHKARMEEYKAMLGLPSQAVSAPENYNPFASFIKPPDVSAPVRSGLPEAPRASSYNAFPSQLGALTPALTPGSLQDAGVKGYGGSSLTPALPRQDPPKPAPPASFNIPKRPF